MIEESYVSFNTAKMLKEAGFDVPTRGIYHTNREGNHKFSEYDRYQTSDDLSWNCGDGFQYEYLAPTQALAARWLREVHRIVVDATFIPPSTGGDVWQYFIGKMDDMVWKGDFEPSDRRYKTYEEALEEGLKRSLELLKK